MTEPPGELVSVVIPAYNAERHLAQAVASVLAQGHRPLEVLVVDDGSSDGTAALARSFGPPVACAVQPHAGAGAARNRGVELARGTLLAFLDADDLWMAGKLERQCRALAAAPELEAVFGLVRRFREGGGAVAGDATWTPGHLFGTMLIRRAAFDRVGPCATTIALGEFIDWYLRGQEVGLRVRMLPEPALLRRIHGANLGILQRDRRSDYARVLKAALDRRRGRPS